MSDSTPHPLLHRVEGLKQQALTVLRGGNRELAARLLAEARRIAELAGLPPIFGLQGMIPDVSAEDVAEHDFLEASASEGLPTDEYSDAWAATYGPQSGFQVVRSKDADVGGAFGSAARQRGGELILSEAPDEFDEDPESLGLPSLLEQEWEDPEAAHEADHQDTTDDFPEDEDSASSDPPISDLLDDEDDTPLFSDDDLPDGWRETDELEGNETDLFDYPALLAEEDLARDDEQDTAPLDWGLDDLTIEARLKRFQRARQIAFLLGSRYGWDTDQSMILARVFFMHRWSAAQRSMRRELEAGMTPDELEIALTAREVWRMHPEFHLQAPSSYFHYRNPDLPWPYALALAREYTWTPCSEEIEDLLLELHDHWISRSSLKEVAPSFLKWVKLSLGLERQYLVHDPFVSFEPQASWRCIDDEIEASPGRELVGRGGCWLTVPDRGQP